MMVVRRKKHAIILLVILLAAQALTTMPARSQPAPQQAPQQQSNWLSGWQYRVPVLIVNPNNQTLADYQVKIELDTARLISQGKMRSDCGDLRVMQGDTALPYWIEDGCNTNHTTIWTKIPNIPPQTTTTIHIYYGNPSAVSTSNGDSVFLVFEDFSTDNKWSLYKCEINVSDRCMVCSQGGSDYSVLNYRKIPMYNIIIDVIWTTFSNDGPNAGIDIGIDSSTGGGSDGSNRGNWYLVAPESAGYYKIWKHTDTSWSNIRKISRTMPTNIKIHSSISIISNGTIKYYENNTLIDRYTDPNPLQDDGGYLAIREWNGKIYLITVRKYAPEEPRVWVGGEEIWCFDGVWDIPLTYVARLVVNAPVGGTISLRYENTSRDVVLSGGSATLWLAPGHKYYIIFMPNLPGQFLGDPQHYYAQKTIREISLQTNQTVNLELPRLEEVLARVEVVNASGFKVVFHDPVSGRDISTNGNATLWAEPGIEYNVTFIPRGLWRNPLTTTIKPGPGTIKLRVPPLEDFPHSLAYYVVTGTVIGLVAALLLNLIPPNPTIVTAEPADGKAAIIGGEKLGIKIILKNRGLLTYKGTLEIKILDITRKIEVKIPGRKTITIEI